MTSTGGYRPLFDPRLEKQPFDQKRAYRLGDRGTSDSLPYVYDNDIVLAVNVALAAGRPLLVRGHPGTGKSTLARSVAERLGWRFYADTVSSRTSARDLLWTFDTVARLADAQAVREGEPMPPRAAYLQPGVLWWAFDPDLARRRGLDQSAGDLQPARDPAVVNPAAERAVVLIDEIDKADPDVPNDLLVPLGSYQFRVTDGPRVVARRVPLIIVTTNEERELPRAFLRRCVILGLRQPDPDRLDTIARAHFEDLTDPLLEAVRGEYLRLRAERIAQYEPPPSVAEFLDALAACRGLGLDTGSAAFKELTGLLLAKMMTIQPEER
ncbi:MoxR family ATPase [Actinoplanes sp. NPDC048796]|uniref:AAA family ATPase n=1 Tax=Actinoplanes sp. NPDC048796 TaxID=3155640 RepID=UPI0033F9BB9F